MTEQSRGQPRDDVDPDDGADPGATRQPAEGGREEVAELPGADTASTAHPEEVRRDDA